jgi:hypothetical protein
MKVKKILIILLVLLLVGGSTTASVILFIKNTKLIADATEQAAQNVQLQQQIAAIGQLVDIWTINKAVKVGDQVQESDLTRETVPVTAVPEGAVQDTSEVIGKYYKLSFGAGIPLTKDLFMDDELKGPVYIRDVFLDSVPVGIMPNDYIDIRVVLPGGEEFVAFSHRRIESLYQKAIKMKMTESDLWLWTSILVDRSLYKGYGLKIYATKYEDPGLPNEAKPYYPLRKEVIDIASISKNLSKKDIDKIYNKDLRAAVYKKLAYWADENNEDTSKIVSGVTEEESRYDLAQAYWESIQASKDEEGVSSRLDEEQKRAEEQAKEEEALRNGGSVSTDTTPDTSSNTGSSLPEKTNETIQNGTEKAQNNINDIDNIIDGEGDKIE